MIAEAGYEVKNIVRLNVYTTPSEEFFVNFNILQEWISANEIQQASTLLEVNMLFETLEVELEATVVT